MERVPKLHLNRNLRRERDPRARVRQFVLLVCGLALAGGFVLAAKQQYAATHLGYQREDLRRERDRLLDEQRQLLLTLERQAAPAQLERAARALGLQPTRASQIGVPQEKMEKTERSAPHAATAFVGSAAAGAALRR